MALRIFSKRAFSKQAQTGALLIVLAVLALMGGSAYLLSSNFGNQITGFATTVGSCNYSIDSPGSWSLAGSLACGANSYGINISSPNVSLNCAGNSITSSSSGSYGIKIWNSTGDLGNITIEDCVISGFGSGIVIETNLTNTIGEINLTENIITANSFDMQFSTVGVGRIRNVTAWNNNFRGGGIQGGASCTNCIYCLSNRGNFYKQDISASNRGSGDCGPVSKITNSTGGLIPGISLYNISVLWFNWSAQSAASATPITYRVWAYDETGWNAVTIVDNTSYVLGTDTFISNTPVNLRIIPWDGVKNGTINETGEFYISNDNDCDNSSVLNFSTLQAVGLQEQWDCNDANSSIHRPSTRENTTNTELGSSFCYNTVDDDCDNTYSNGGIDWLDYGCGGGFTPGSFNSTLYTNGTIRNLTTSANAAGNNYALVENTYGRIEYRTATNLTNVNFDNIFSFSQNSIVANTSATLGSRFNKSATVTFRGLTGFQRVPVLFVGSSLCPSSVCSDIVPNQLGKFSDYYNLTFTAAHFSTFTVQNNSQFGIFTQNDSEARSVLSDAPKSIEEFHRVKFFANYTQNPSGAPINNRSGGVSDVTHNGTCNITLYNSDGNQILRTDDEIINYHFTYNNPSPWTLFDSNHLNSTVIYSSPAERYIVQLDVLNNTCATHNYSCYKLVAPSVMTNTSNTYYNLSFRAKSNVTGKPVIAAITSVDLENYNVTFNLTTSWATYWFNYTFNATGGAANLSFHLNSTTTGSNFTIYLDDIMVKTNRSKKMDYNSYYDVYEYESGVNDFREASAFYRYNISCAADIFEPMNLSELFTVNEDTTAPIKPVLYPQINIHSDNITENSTTFVAGYFNESDINYNLMILHGTFTYEFSGTSGSSEGYSEFKDDAFIVNFDASVGENVTFAAWSEDFEEAVKYFKYAEFSNHNRSYFDRYEIYRANRTGDDLRLEFYDSLETAVPAGTRIRLYTTEHPPGYFIKEVALYNGANRITVWGSDLSGNSGNASTDWINAPYSEAAPVAPELWPLPEAIKFNTNLSVFGFINDSQPTTLNMTINIVQGDYFNYTWDTDFSSSTQYKTASLTSARPADSDFFYISEAKYDEIRASYTWADLWVDFSNHNLSLWKRYDVTSALKNPGEDPRVYISPNLTSSVSAGTVASFHNHSFKQGFFNISVNTTTYLKNGSNTVYALALRNSTEGNASASRSIFVDNALPAFTITLIPNYSYSTTPTFTFNVTDNYKVNISSLIVNISNSTGWNNSYTYNSSAVSLSSAIKNISCSDYFGNGSVYNCSFTLNTTVNGTYTVNFSVYDVANWFFNLTHSLDMVVSTVDISSVLDEDDITNDAWLYFNWTPGAGAVSEYEFALGNTTYPNHGYNSSKNWTSMCNATSSCTRAWINLTHDSNASDVNRTEVKMKTGTVYYLTVRAKSPTNEYGTPASSNGIMFIDQTTPNVSSINDHGPWSNSNSQLSATWVFTDSESDVIEYQYALGTAVYPDPNYRSISGPTTTTSTSVVNSGLSLTENATYYYNVRARNGNSALNYSGSWSSWQSSSGTRVDTVAPAGGFIRWQNYSFTNVDFVTINYDVGVDAGSANVQGLIEIGRGVLSGGICPSISDFDFYNASDVLTARNAYKDVNVTSGYCYVFRLFVWDNASNSNNYRADNETLKVVKADTSPPSDIAPVVDDGFFTNSRTSLHANWADSSDAESGFNYYQWRIVREPVGVDICDVNTTHPVGTNCAEVAAGNTTVSEVSVTSLDLVHNYKYYFEVIAYNKANSNSSKRYSDGIIYLDNSAPGDVILIGVNNVTTASSPYYTQIQTPVINITAIGDLDGYNDIANCVLLNATIDYTESSQYAVNCTETANYNFNTTYTNVTYIQCSKNTTFNGTALQGTWSWYISCRDYYENSNDFNGNVLTEFTVDWPEAPVFNISSLSDITGSSAVYSDDDLYCSVQLSDPDALKNINTTVTFDWLRGSTVLKSTTAIVTNNSNSTYSASDSLTANFTYRGNNITCRVNATDNTSIWRNLSLSLIINNTPPSSLILVSPDSETANAQMNFSWSGPSDDVDSDFMTLKVQSDNETNFNVSNNPGIAFGVITKLTVEGITIPGTQRNADVYGTKIVYEDDRTGNWDIYLYDILTDTETAVATSTSHQYNPQIYGDYVVYEQNNSDTFAVYLYNISNAQTTAVVSGINYTSMDYFGNYIVYNDGSGVRLRAINNLTGEVSIFTAQTAANLSVYGKNIVWTNSSDKSVWLYDYSNLSAHKRPQFGPAKLFGYFLVSENNSVINVTNLQNGTSINLSGFNASIYGNKLVYCNASGGITITDLLTTERFNVSLDIGNAPAIYDKLVVYENSSDLWYSTQTAYLRGSFIVEKSSSNYYEINTSLSNDDGYVWRIEGCDNSFIANSCAWSQTILGASYALFTIDNTAPVFSSISPAAESVVAGQFRVYSTITDNLGTDYVSSANYSVSYRSNGTVRFSGNLSKSGSTWSSSILNFLDHSLANFTLKLYAIDSMANLNSTSINFSINNATSWFAFGSGSDELLDNVTVINGSINSDFVAYTVLTSTLRIIGPSPASTVRFISSQNNLSVTNHNYSDPISVLTWPDGSYRTDFSGTNLDGNNTANRTFFVDNNYPRWYDNTTSPNGTIYASNALVLSINWSDSTLREVNITYNNTNISNVSNEAILTDVNNGTISSGIFISSSLNISSYINKTFYWWSSARDSLNRSNSTNNTIYWSVFVNSNPPTRTADLTNMSVAEDSTNSSPFDLSSYFSDVNDGGVWGHLDNLTYNIAHNCSTNLSFTYNTTTGAVYNVTSAGNYTGLCGVNTTATDTFGKFNTSNFTLYIYSQNDAPSIRNSSGAIIPAQSVAEDSVSPIQLDLSLYEYDIDGDAVTWQTPTSWNTSLISVSYNSVTKMVNLTPQSNKFGVVNVTFTLQDNASTALTAVQNVTVTVTSQADAPTQPNITNPLANVNESDPIIITWDASTDADGDSLNYSLFYTTNGGSSWNRIVDLVGASTTIYYWNSSVNFSSDQANVTLRVNVTDGTNVNSTTTSGNFSVDNKAPQITVVSPAVAYLVISSGVGVVNVTTQENSSCSFSSNVSGISSSVTSNGTFHNASLSTLVVNVSYRINASCTDTISNTNWTTVDFAAKSAALEVISVTASPSAAISSNVVNLTLQIFSLAPWHFINVTVNNSNGISNYLSISNFTSQINSSNSYTYTNSSLNISSTGRHDVTIVRLNNTDGTVLTSLFYANVFEVFPQVNQTLNII